MKLTTMNISQTIKGADRNDGKARQNSSVHLQSQHSGPETMDGCKFKASLEHVVSSKTPSDIKQNEDYYRGPIVETKMKAGVSVTVPSL